MWDAGDAREHVGQPGQRIDIVELCRRNERGHGGCPGSAAFGTGEEPRFSSQSEASERPLGSIVREANSAVVEEAREAIPAPEQIIDRLDDRGRAGQPGALIPQPCFQGSQQRPALFLPHAQGSPASRPLMARSMSNSASMRLTASKAMGEIAGACRPRRALAAMSASSKN